VKVTISKFSTSFTTSGVVGFETKFGSYPFHIPVAETERVAISGGVVSPYVVHFYMAFAFTHSDTDDAVK
jgi:hypothetical protein